MQVVLRQEARLASEVALHQEVRMSPEVVLGEARLVSEVALRQEVRMALLVVLSKGTREGRMLDWLKFEHGRLGFIQENNRVLNFKEKKPSNIMYCLKAFDMLSRCWLPFLKRVPTSDPVKDMYGIGARSLLNSTVLISCTITDTRIVST